MKFFLNCLFVLLFSSFAKAQCPVIEGAMVNACGTNEGLNEFVLFTTKTAAVAGDYTLYYGDNSIPSLGLPVNILAGINATTPAGSGTIFSTNGCIINQVTSAATAIPANSTVLFIPSGFDANYDITPVCAAGSVYVVYIDISVLPSLWNAAGVFANNTATTGYLQITNGATLCTSDIRSYDYNWTADTDGNAVWWDAGGNKNYNNNGCSFIAPAVTITNIIALPVCAGNTSTSATYTTSGNPDEYTLVWDAAAMAAGFVNVTNAALTGSPLTIAVPALATPSTYNASLIVKNTISGISSVAQPFTTVVDPQVIPAFNPIAPICNGDVAPVLPTTSVNGITGTWSPAVVSNTTSAIYTFTPSGGFCATTTTLPVTVEPLPTAFLFGTTTSCYGTSANVIFNGTPNATVTYTINGGAPQTTTLSASGSKIINSGILTTDLTYSLVSITSAGLPGCSQSLSNTAVITVVPLNVATITGTTTICSGTGTSINFNGTPNATVGYNINNGAIQSVVLDATGNAILNTGNLTANAVYKLVSVINAGLPACLHVISGTATVTVAPLPTASISGTTSICNGTATSITFTGTPNAIVTYNVDGITPYQTIVLNAAGSATLNTGNLLVTRTYNLVSVANSASPACTQSVTGSVVVTVKPVTNPPLVNPSVVYCQNEITIPLLATGTGLLWYSSASATTGSATPPTPGSSVAGSTDYYVTQTLNGCESVRSVITVTVNPTPVIPSVPLIAVYRCGTGPVALKASAPGIVRWYSDSAQTNFLIESPSFSPIISATTTFYVTNTENGCVSAPRAVVATVFPLVVQVTRFSYSPATVCPGSPGPVPVPASGFVLGGVYSSTPGLSINSITGVINPLTSTPGTYTVKYGVGAAICTLAASSTTTITINKSTVPVTTFSYPSPVCTSGVNPAPVPDAGFVTGGTYSSTTGLSVNAATGVIDLSASSGGTYTVTYSLNATACTTPATSTATITIVAPVAATVTGGIIQRCGSGVVNLSATGAGIIKWYSDAGLSGLLYTGNAYAPSVNATTTFYVTSTEGLCVSPQTSVVATVIPVTTQVTTFSYSPSTVCAGSPDPVPVPSTGFVPGGIYSSAAGLTLNSSTGVIDASTSSPGTYIVKYAVAGYQCVLAGSSTNTISISKTTTSETTFSYPATVCSNADNPMPLHTSGFTTGGIFSSSAGLAVNSLSGVIDLKTSTPGSYSISYTVAPSPCTTGGSSQADITIVAAPAAPVTKGGQRCGSGALTLDATASGTLNWYSSADLSRLLATGTSYTVTVNNTTDFYVTASNGNCASDPAVVTAHILPLPLKPDLGKTNTLCEGDTIVLNPGYYDNYLWQDNSTAPTFTLTSTGIYSLTVKGTNGCSNATSISIAPSNTCSDILFPSAFSPNGDQLNDNFGPLPYRNLAYVSSYTLRIFNRYGQVVFTTTNPYQKWDGSQKGEIGNTGNFMWTAEYIYSNGSKKTKKGNVVIVR